MAFSLDHSLTHIEIKEPDLAEIYRSSNSVVPPEEQCQGHLCEAYVCSAREDGRFCVYVAFFDTTTQRPVILSTTCDVLKPADQKRLVNEALKLTKSMGFDMEPVKLDLQRCHAPGHYPGHQRHASTPPARETAVQNRYTHS